MVIAPDCKNIAPGNPLQLSTYQEVMEWAGNNLNNIALKLQIEQYCKTNDLDWTMYQNAADWQFSTAGKIAYIINHGGEPPQESLIWLENQLLKIQQLMKKPKPESDVEAKMNSREKQIMTFVNSYSYIDAIRVKYQNDPDKISELINARLMKRNLSVSMLKQLYKHFKELLTDTLALSSDPVWAVTIEPLVIVVNILASKTGNATAAISSKKLGAKVASRASKMTVKTVDIETGLVTIDPGLVVGAQMALTYNTKNRRISVYVAGAGQTLDIKGQYIINFDENNSYAKTLKKPKETLIATNINSPRRVNVVFKEFQKSKAHSITGKMGKDTLIIKVFNQ